MAKFTYLEGVMFFPFIFEQKDKFDRYSVALGIEGDQVKQAKKLKLPVKQDEDKMDGMIYVQLKSNYKPELFDVEGEEYSGRPYNNKFGEGITTFMSAVKITDPIEFVPEGGGKKRFDQADDEPFSTGDEAPF